MDGTPVTEKEATKLGLFYNYTW